MENSHVMNVVQREENGLTKIKFERNITLPTISETSLYKDCNYIAVASGPIIDTQIRTHTYIPKFSTHCFQLTNNPKNEIVRKKAIMHQKSLRQNASTNNYNISDIKKPNKLTFVHRNRETPKQAEKSEWKLLSLKVVSGKLKNRKKIVELDMNIQNELNKTRSQVEKPKLGFFYTNLTRFNQPKNDLKSATYKISILTTNFSTTSTRSLFIMAQNDIKSIRPPSVNNWNETTLNSSFDNDYILSLDIITLTNSSVDDSNLTTTLNFTNDILPISVNNSVESLKSPMTLNSSISNNDNYLKNSTNKTSETLNSLYYSMTLNSSTIKNAILSTNSSLDRLKSTILNTTSNPSSSKNQNFTSSISTTTLTSSSKLKVTKTITHNTSYPSKTVQSVNIIPLRTSTINFIDLKQTRTNASTTNTFLTSDYLKQTSSNVVELLKVTAVIGNDEQEFILKKLLNSSDELEKYLKRENSVSTLFLLDLMVNETFESSLLNESAQTFLNLNRNVKKYVSGLIYWSKKLRHHILLIN